MTEAEYHFLLSDRDQLRWLIARTLPGEVIVRGGFQYRLQKVEAKIAAYEAFQSSPGIQPDATGPEV